MTQMLQQNVEAGPTMTAVLLGHLRLNFMVQEEIQQLNSPLQASLYYILYYIKSFQFLKKSTDEAHQPLRK